MRARWFYGPRPLVSGGEMFCLSAAACFRRRDVLLVRGGQFPVERCSARPLPRESGAVSARTEACGCRFTASLLSSSYPIFTEDQIFLDASLLTKDPAKIERPCTGALAYDLQHAPVSDRPFFFQYTGGQEHTRLSFSIVGPTLSYGWSDGFLLRGGKRNRPLGDGLRRLKGPVP